MRFAVIGTNFITDWFIENGRRAEGFELRAVYSRTPERAREFAGKYGVERTYTDLDELAAADDIDAVYIASPNKLHHDHAIKMLRAKKHVLVEKPAAMNRREAEEMFAAAEENGVFLMEAMRPVHNPGLNIIKDNLYKLGDVRRAVVTYCQYSSRYDRFKAGEVLNAFDPALENAAIMDIGVYACHLMTALFGRPDTVAADSVFLNNGFEGAGVLSLGYGGMIGEVEYSKITDGANRSELQGENGSMLIGEVRYPEDVMIRYRDGREERLDIPRTGGDTDLIYEIRDFMALTPDSAARFRSWTLETLYMMDEARRALGIHFAADEGRMLP